MSDRWQMYTAATPEVAAGWTSEPLTSPSRLYGSNGMTIGGDGRLYVTQVFGSQVTAIDVDSGAHEVYSPLGSGIVGPDDAFFGADGTFYATEPLIGRVSARDPDGSYRVVRDDLPGANGVTMDAARQRLFVDEFRPEGRLMELDPHGDGEPRFLMEGLDGPNAPSVGPDGRLYFPQVFANQVWVYDLDAGRGELLFDDLNVPTAVKFDSRGRLVVSEAGAGRITAIDMGTGERTTLAEVPKGIDNLSIGAGDRLFVSHYVNGRVAEETGGRHHTLSEPGLLGPHSVAALADGALLVADGLSVARVDLDGTVERLITLLIDLHTLAVGACSLGDDLAVLAVTGEVLLYPLGASEPSVLASGLATPTSIIADGPDAVLVAESTAGQITRVGRDGRTEVVASGLRRAAGVGRDDATGTIYVSTGPTVEAVGSESAMVIDGFGDAQGIAVEGGTLLVADVDRHELVAVELSSGSRSVVMTNAPIGAPTPGVVPVAFCSVCAEGPHGQGGFFVGANGDGSIRRLRRG